MLKFTIIFVFDIKLYNYVSIVKPNFIPYVCFDPVPQRALYAICHPFGPSYKVLKLRKGKFTF